MSAITLLLVLIAVALLFDFLNGFHDSANVVATIIASRAMSARGALALAALANLAGPFLLGVAVAETVGAEVVQAQAVSIAVVLAALLAASLWNVATWYFGIPVSSSHALVGGIVGAAATGSGFAAIQAQRAVEDRDRLARLARCSASSWRWRSCRRRCGCCAMRRRRPT